LWILCFGAWSIEGCVLPIGPDFRNPRPGEDIPELLPAFTRTNLPLEMTEVIDASLTSPPKLFEVELQDPNPGDSITIRWVTNYPPFNTGTKSFPPDTMLPPDPMLSLDQRIFRFSRTFDCTDFPMSADRNLVVIASDRGFAPPEVAAQTDIDNQFNYYYDDQHKLTKTNIMVGWRITVTGCQQ
jgi:hypothetical protein